MNFGRSIGKDSKPCDQCRGQCCTFAPMTRREFKTIRKKYGVPDGSTVINVGEPKCVMVVKDQASGECSYLADGRCSVYVDRPWICRAYGDNDTFPCLLARPAQAEAKLRAIASAAGVKL